MIFDEHLWLDLLRQSTVVLSPQGVPQYHKYHTAPLTVPFLKLMGMTIWTVGLQTRLVAVPFRSDGHGNYVGNGNLFDKL